MSLNAFWQGKTLKIRLFKIKEITIKEVLGFMKGYIHTYTSHIYVITLNF